jgi:ankyrin repeat protein
MVVPQILVEAAEAGNVSESNMVLPQILVEAAEAGDVSSIENYLSKGGDVNARSRFQSTMLHLASRAGQPSVVSLLLSCGADVNAIDYVRPCLLALSLFLRTNKLLRSFSLFAGGNAKDCTSLGLPKGANLVSGGVDSDL